MTNDAWAGIREAVAAKLRLAGVPPRVLLSRFRFLDDQSRGSRECLDPRYLPFYYHLGAQRPARALLGFGFGLGLSAACYLAGSPATEAYLAVQEPLAGYYSPRLGVANVKQAWRGPFHVHLGAAHDEAFLAAARSRSWDVALVAERRGYDTYMGWLGLAWDVVGEGGLICVDHVVEHEQAGRAYADFCVVRHREPFVFDTRYGVGAVVR